MIIKKMLPLLILFGLITSPAMAEKFYIWTDAGGVLNMTNHPGFAPTDMRPEKEGPSWPVARPAIVAPPSPAPPAPVAPPKVQMAGGETPQTTPLEKVEQAIETIENRNEAIKKLQELIQKLMPGGPSPKPSQPDSTQ